MIKILLSKKLGELRLTQADLARATGIRPNTINELYHELADRVNDQFYDRERFCQPQQQKILCEEYRSREKLSECGILQ